MHFGGRRSLSPTLIDLGTGAKNSVLRLEETTQTGGDGARGFLGAAAFVGVYMGQGGSHAPSTGSIAALPVFPLLEEAAALQVRGQLECEGAERKASVLTFDTN